MARAKPINRDNEDLIGQTYRRPGSISNKVVIDIDGETEGLVHVAHAETMRAVGMEEATVVRRHLK